MFKVFFFMIDVMKKNINNDIDSIIDISKLFVTESICPVILNSNEENKALPIQCGVKCTICLDKIEATNNVITSCNHYFCLSCLLKHLETDNKCPLCREEIEEKRPFKYKKILLSDIIKYIEDHFDSNSLSHELLAIKNFTKNTYQMLASFLKLHMIQISQKILQHQYGLNDDEESEYDEDDDDEDDNDEENDDEENDDEENDED